ncbi:hypothetical protein LCGC14_2875630 [marine sediment metagenome]|uniref:Uncharacterized protein n=1 Tax=marine sediment metagenome TaxID=412755 RepID=A0A0F9A9M2_9ZZZZ
MRLMKMIEEPMPCIACIYEGVVSKHFLEELTELGVSELCTQHKRQHSYYLKSA